MSETPKHNPSNDNNITINNITKNINNNNNIITPEISSIPSHILKIMSQQPTINIITLGNVSNGKSTLMWAFSNEKTGKSKKEKVNNMTIKLGYTQIKIFKCNKCPINYNYFLTKSNKIKPRCPKIGCNNVDNILIRHISFIDAPGHSKYLGTMMQGISVIDAALLVTNVSLKDFPSKQTRQHFDIAHLLGVFNGSNNSNYYDIENDIKYDHDDDEHVNGNKKNSNNIGYKNNDTRLIIAQNKIDLVTKDIACKNVEHIRNFLSEYNTNLIYKSPIIPICAEQKFINDLVNCIIDKFPKYSNKLNINNLNYYNLKFDVIRSFDINKPQKFTSINDIDNLFGGTIGCCLDNGSLKIGDSIELKPGLIKYKTSFKPNPNIDKKSPTEQYQYYTQSIWKAHPLKTTVISLYSGTNKLSTIYPGGNVGIGLSIDPSLTKNDKMVGQIGLPIIDNNNIKNYDKYLNKKNKYKIFNQFIMSYVLLNNDNNKKKKKNHNFELFETIKLNIGSNKIEGKFLKNIKLNKNENGLYIWLSRPICAKIGDIVGVTKKSDIIDYNDNYRYGWEFNGAGVIRKIREIIPVKDYNKF